jgi:LysR family transcriptional regulator (chromosome initiation inhibitor)
MTDVADPDLAQLRALAAVVDEGSFEAAAAALHVTQSAVSQRIKALEAAAGQVLVRRARPAGVTDAGRTYLRLARQVTALVHEAQQELVPSAGGPVTIPVAVNADSLATWVLPALAPLAGRVCLDLHREDQDRTADLLRAGTVMAAIAAVEAPVQGCRSTRLGVMRYRPVATPAFVQRWFAAGVAPETLAAAPVVVFDRSDDLQDAYLRTHQEGLRPPRHHVPASADFAGAVRLGYGWGMLPDEQVRASEGRVVELDPGHHVDVTLFWQQWALRTPTLDLIADAVRSAAATHLRQEAGRGGG